MASISTKSGDQGQTRLIGGICVSKSHLRVEAYGTLDELNSVLGFARSLCEDPEVCHLVKSIQRELFTLSSALATPPDSHKQPPSITPTMVNRLTEQVQRLENLEGIPFEWSLPGEHTVSSTFEVARTVCRRAERHIVRLLETGESIDPNILPYMNRLSDLLWLLGRLIEWRAGVDGRFRKSGD